MDTITVAFGVMFSFLRNALEKQVLYFRGKKGRKENIKNTVYVEILVLGKNNTN